MANRGGWNGYGNRENYGARGPDASELMHRGRDYETGGFSDRGRFQLDTEFTSTYGSNRNAFHASAIPFDNGVNVPGRGSQPSANEPRSGDSFNSILQKCHSIIDSCCNKPPPAPAFRQNSDFASGADSRRSTRFDDMERSNASVGPTLSAPLGLSTSSLPENPGLNYQPQTYANMQQLQGNPIYPDQPMSQTSHGSLQQLGLGVASPDYGVAQQLGVQQQAPTFRQDQPGLTAPLPESPLSGTGRSENTLPPPVRSSYENSDRRSERRYEDSRQHGRDRSKSRERLSSRDYRRDTEDQQTRDRHDRGDRDVSRVNCSSTSTTEY